MYRRQLRLPILINRPMPPSDDAPLLMERLVEAEHAGCRLDVFLARQLPEFSRAHLRRAIDAGGVKVGDRIMKAGQRLKGGEQLSITLPQIPREGPVPENIPL